MNGNKSSADRSREERAAAHMRRVRARLDYDLRTAFSDLESPSLEQILDVIAPIVEEEFRYKDGDVEHARREVAHAKAALHWLRQQARKAIYVHERQDRDAGKVVDKVKSALDDERSVSPREIHSYSCVIDYKDNQATAVNWGSKPEGDYEETDYSTPQVSRSGGEGRMVFAFCFDLDLCREAFEAAKAEAERELAARE